MIDEALFEQARENLQRRAAALHGMRFADIIQRDFTFEEIKVGLEHGAIRAWARPLLGPNIKSAAIYRLSVNNQHGANTLRQAFADLEAEGGHVFARNNDVPDSTTIYVGSSKDVGGRLQQHLHTCAKGTYALKMRHWCPVADFRVRVEVAVANGVVEPSQIQDVEDALWIKSRPMFGKFGAR